MQSSVNAKGGFFKIICKNLTLSITLIPSFSLISLIFYLQDGMHRDISYRKPIPNFIPSQPRTFATYTTALSFRAVFSAYSIINCMNTAAMYLGKDKLIQNL